MKIASVEPRLELRLADGRLLRLAGLDAAQQTPNNPDLGETTREALGVRLTGKVVQVRVLASTPDRWGRLAAFVFPGGGSQPGGIAAQAMAAGWGRYLVEPPAHACRSVLIDAEAKARDAKLGLWNDPYYAVVAVDDREAFVERSATLVVAEGRLVDVQPGPYRTTLRFADPEPSGSSTSSSGQRYRGGPMLVATIAPRVMKTFEAQKIDLRTLVGHRLRLRGLLDIRFGPRIELATPDEIEPIDTPPSATAAVRAN